MAKLRARSDTGMLYMDFMYGNNRCREQTALKDTKENRKRVQALLDSVLNEIELGTFDYAKTFPGSPKAKKFAASAKQTTPASRGSDEQKPDNQSAAFSDFAALWQIEMSPQWKRSHRMGVEEILTRNPTVTVSKLKASINSSKVNPRRRFIGFFHCTALRQLTSPHPIVPGHCRAANAACHRCSSHWGKIE